MISDLRFAYRQLVKFPGFTAVVIFTLALGIGANTAIFSIINATFLRSLPYLQPDRILYIGELGRNGNEMAVSYPNFLDWEKQQDSFEALAIHTVIGQKLIYPEGVNFVHAGLVSGGFFQTLGIHSALGRDLSPKDDLAGAAPVAWITHTAWQRYFAGKTELLGSTVSLGGQSVTIVGILPASFRIHQQMDFLIPFAQRAKQEFMMERENRNRCSVMARLKQGVSIEAARTQMGLIAKRLEAEYPQPNSGVGVTVVPLRDHITGDSRSSLILLWGAGAMVLLIACVNVANMLLARSYTREKEMAIRTSLGATRLDLLRQLLAESLLLAFAGGFVGVFLGAWGYEFAYQLIPWGLRSMMSEEGGFDVGMMVFAVIASVTTGILFGLAPAWRLSHSDPNSSLKSDGASMKTVFGRFRPSDALVIAQVALALMLLIGAGLMVRSMAQLLHVRTGLQAEQALTLRVSVPEQYQRDMAGYISFHERIVDQVRGIPGVEEAGFGTSLPFSWSVSEMVIFRTDRPIPKPNEFPEGNTHYVTPGYLPALGIPLLRGRSFDGHEPVPALPAGKPISEDMIGKLYEGIELHCLVSQRMAESLWPGEDALGKQFQLGFPNMNLPKAKVIGIVGNTTQRGLDQRVPSEFYISLRQFPAPMSQFMVVRTKDDPSLMIDTVRKSIATMAVNESVFDMRPMSSRIDTTVADRRFNTGLLLCFAGVALVLAAIGIYGVLAFSVSQRTREVGIRIALGAKPEDVLKGILLRGFILVIPGALIGAVGSWIGSRLLQSQLYTISGTDPLTYLAGALLLLAIAFAACWIPARRAMRINPVEALRSE